MTSIASRLATLGVVLVAAAPSLSHESLLRNIAAVTEAIEGSPRDPALYLQRGELHRLHRDWNKAQADFERAAALAPESEEIDFYLGRMHLEAGRPALALAHLSRYLAIGPEHPEARLARARALAALDRTLESAAEYALALERRPSPEIYLERADVLVARGEGNEDLAIQGLTEGIAALGPVPGLELRVIELELERGDVDAALDRIGLVIASSRQEAPWLVRRAEILETVERTEEAEDDYEAALAALSGIPEHRRQTRMFQDLENRIRTSLERLARRRISEQEGMRCW